MWWDNLCNSNIKGTQRGPFEEKLCKEFPGRKTNCLTFRKEMRALKRRTSTSSKISYHRGDKWSLSKSLLWWPSPCRMLTLVPPDEDLAHSFLKCPSPQPWGTICMLHETFLSPLQVHDLPLQPVSIQHRQLKQKVTHCYSVQETLLSPLLQPPLCSHTLSHLSWPSQRQNLFIADLILDGNLPSTSSPPCSAFPSREQGQAARELPKT